MYRRVVRKIIKLLQSTLVEKQGEAIALNQDEGRTVEDLVFDLDKIPVEKNSIVFIHTGFKSIGNVQGGPSAVVDAIVESFVIKRNVTVAMPSFTLNGSMDSYLKKNIVFDVKKAKTVYRGIPSAFQQLQDLHRSIHPTHSVMAVGPKAEWLVDSHHLCGTTFGKDSPFARLLETKSYIMGLGTRLGTVTFYHVLEDMAENFPFRVYTEDSPFKAKCVDHVGNLIEMQVFAHDGSISPVRIDRPNADWLRDIYTSILEKREQLTWHSVGKARTWICDASELFDTQKQLTFNGLSIYSTPQDVAEFVLRKVWR